MWFPEGLENTPLNKFTVMGGNLKFQVQDSDLEYIFLEIWRFEKHIALSETKPPLDALQANYLCRLN